MVSTHGIIRGKERLQSKSRKAIERRFALACERGRTSAEFSGWEQRYLISKERAGCFIRVHNSFLFVFSCEQNGITVYPLPEWFGKRVTSDRRRKPGRTQSSIRFYEDIFMDTDEGSTCCNY